MPSEVLALLGRLLMALLFLGGAVQKIADPEPVQQMLSGAGLPVWMAWPLAAFNLVAGTCLVAGPRVALWAILLAVYCIVTSFFHWQLRADPWQVSIMVKNWAIAGGLLVVAAYHPHRGSSS